MPIKVLIASHLGSKYRYITIQETLKSIAEQTVLPDSVLISYSYKTNPPDIQKWRDILSPIPITLVHSEEKLYQFDHYKRLLGYISDDDILCFSDDDDLYHPRKIQCIKQVLKSPEFKGIIRHKYKIFHCNNPLLGYKDKIVVDTQLYDTEYWCCVIIGKIFKDFFKLEIYNQAYKTMPYTMDVLLNVWLSCSECPAPPYNIDDCLMYMRKCLLIPRDYR